VDVYVTPDGRSPFDDWLKEIKDPVGRSAIDMRVNKLRRGLIGDYDDVGDGVIELRFVGVGPGYRIYCVDNGASTLILLGGTKRTQKADIVRAKSYWTAYQRGR